VYQVSPPVGSYYNVIYVISGSKVIPDTFIDKFYYSVTKAMS